MARQESCKAIILLHGYLSAVPGLGGFNDENLNGARGGFGEDKLGHCGACGGAIAIVARRIDLTAPRQHGENEEANLAKGCGSGIARSSEQLAPTLMVGAVSVVPADAEAGIFRRETMDLLRQLRPTILRWPGGNFVSGCAFCLSK